MRLQNLSSLHFKASASHIICKHLLLDLNLLFVLRLSLTHIIHLDSNEMLWEPPLITVFFPRVLLSEALQFALMPCILCPLVRYQLISFVSALAQTRPVITWRGLFRSLQKACEIEQFIKMSPCKKPQTLNQLNNTHTYTPKKKPKKKPTKQNPKHNSSN